MEPAQRIGDYPFDISYMCFDESRYEEFLQAKHAEMRNRFTGLFESTGYQASNVVPITLVRSPAKHCRQKCRFAIKRMSELGIECENGNKLAHAMWEEGRPTVLVEAFPIASTQIYHTMPLLLSTIQSSDQYACMVKGFASVHYLSTLSGDLTITMNYDTNAADSFEDEVVGQRCQWRLVAETLHQQLLFHGIPTVRSLSLIGRTKGRKVVVGADFVTEELHLVDGRRLIYKQVEEGFSNPNSMVNQRALDWLCSVAQEAVAGEQGKLDLLEMYCGNGNHTVALAAYFHQVMGVEINPALCAAATENFAINGITNARVIVCDSARFATQILRTKKYILYAPQVVEDTAAQASLTAATAGVDDNEAADSGSAAAASTSVGNKSTAQQRAAQAHERARSRKSSASSEHATGNQRQHSQHKGLKVPKVPLYEYHFGAVLVDPPRCGLDALTLSLVANYSHIIYISCCPDSLMRDLKELLKTHELKKIALFDQFAYTPHIETGVWLQLKPSVAAV